MVRFLSLSGTSRDQVLSRNIQFVFEATRVGASGKDAKLAHFPDRLKKTQEKEGFVAGRVSVGNLRIRFSPQTDLRIFFAHQERQMLRGTDE
jgi:hypothetical protein